MAPALGGIRVAARVRGQPLERLLCTHARAPMDAAAREKREEEPGEKRDDEHPERSRAECPGCSKARQLREERQREEKSDGRDDRQAADGPEVPRRRLGLQPIPLGKDFPVFSGHSHSSFSKGPCPPSTAIPGRRTALPRAGTVSSAAAAWRRDARSRCR